MRRIIVIAFLAAGAAPKTGKVILLGTPVACSLTLTFDRSRP